MTLPSMAASSSNHSQKHHVGGKSMEKEEIIKHMSNLPSYLERGKPIQDRALSFGVMDWGQLEKWQYQHHKQGSVKSNKCLPSSSSSLFSTGGLSPPSHTGQSCSAHQKPHRVTLQSYLNIAPPNVKLGLGNLEKSQDFKDAPVNHCTEKKTKVRDCKTYASYPPNLSESESSIDMGSCQAKSSSSLKGKTKIQDELVCELGNIQHPSYRTHDREHLENHETVVLLPRDGHGKSQTNDADHRNSSEEIRSDLNNNIPTSCPLKSEVVNYKNSRMEPDSARNPSTTSEVKRSSSSKNSHLNKGTIAASKHRSLSPLRRFSFSTSSKSATPTSATKRAESPPVSRHSNRAHSSPLRRLLVSLFPSKTTNLHQSTEMSYEDAKVNSFDGDSRGNEKDESSSTKQALFQTTLKNGRPLFMFAVEDNSGVLAATVKSLSASGKDDSNSTWIYTFFNVHEVKKKTGNWFSQNTKVKGQSFVPNIAAQMKVSNPSISDCNIREFVLFSVDPNRVDCQISVVQPYDQLAAIIVKFVDEEENLERFSTTVILPGGNHGVPSKGEPSPLIERWVSGGACDCGGWDLGCRLRTLVNQVQSRRGSNSTKVHMATGQFELFLQGEVRNERPIFSLSPLTEGVCSVEYNSSLSLLEAFSICISVAECRKSSQHTESRTYVANKVQDDQVPVRYPSFPPLSSFERA